MVLLLRLNIKSEEKHNLHDFFCPRREKSKSKIVKIVKFSSRMWNRILYFNWNMRLLLRSEITWGRNISELALASSCWCLVGLSLSARMVGCQSGQAGPLSSLKLSCAVVSSSQCVVSVVEWGCQQLGGWTVVETVLTPLHTTTSPHLTSPLHIGCRQTGLGAGLGWPDWQNYSSSSSVGRFQIEKLQTLIISQPAAKPGLISLRRTRDWPVWDFSSYIHLQLGLHPDWRWSGGSELNKCNL